MRHYVLLDTETTGADEGDRICQLAFLDVAADSVNAYNDLCKPPAPIGFGAMAIHHITNEMVETAPEYHQTPAAKMLETLNDGENIAVIQNAPFDLGMLAKEGVRWKGPVIDTYRCLRHLEPDLERFGLQYVRYALGFYKEEKALADRFGVTIQAHDALSDVIVLYQLMQHLVAKVGRDVNRLVALTNTPVRIRRFHFGKFKGQEIVSVVQNEPDYLEWVLGNVTLEEDMEFSLRLALAERALGLPVANRRSSDQQHLAWADQRREWMPAGVLAMMDGDV